MVWYGMVWLSGFQCGDPRVLSSGTEQAVRYTGASQYDQVRSKQAVRQIAECWDALHVIT